MTSPPGRVVVLRALGLGDLLTVVPALRALRRAFPEHRLVLAAPGWLEPVASLTGAVDGVLPVVPLGAVPGWPPELAVNLHGHGPESTATLRALEPRELWAYDAEQHDPPRPGTGPPPWDEAEHEVLRWCRLVGAHGVPVDPRDLSLQVPDGLPLAGGLTLVHPGGSAPSRRWPASRWAAVAERLAAQGHEVVVTGSRAEADLCRAVAVGAGLSDGAVLAGRLDVRELCSVVAHARMVLCADTGVGHLATAYGTRSVVLFGPVGPARWGPPADRPRHVALWAGRDSDPFAARPAAGLLEIAVGDVLAACERSRSAAGSTGA